MPPEEVQDNMRLLPGEGVIDLIGFFKALRQIGYAGGVAPETIGPRIPDDMPPEQSARLRVGDDGRGDEEGRRHVVKHGVSVML